MAEAVTNQIPSQNDRIMAALAHVTAILPMMGLIAPIVIWATQKDKSEFVAFQALQATAYQLLMVLLYFIGMGLYMCSFFTMFITMPLVEQVGRDAPVEILGVAFPFLVFGLIILGGLVFVVYGLVGAVMVLTGRNFRYFFLGSWLDHKLEKGGFPESSPT